VDSNRNSRDRWGWRDARDEYCWLAEGHSLATKIATIVKRVRLRTNLQGLTAI
jgi:hypothetical protein